MNCTRLFVPVLLVTSLHAQWNLTTPPVTPGARAGHGMAADALGNVLLFGGVGTPPFHPLNDTWRWDGSTWTQLAPTVAPGVCSSVELVYDIARNRHVVYGGWVAPIGGAIISASNQTWEFDGTTWVQMTPTVSPGGLWGYGACYDLVRSRIVLYGGVPNNLVIAQQDTWEYDGTTWQQIVGASAPGPLYHPAMCFHAASNRTVMFGGSTSPLPSGVDTTWLYDGATWTAANVTSARPSPRTGAKMAYDSTRGVCVLFGGTDPTTFTPLSDTWEFDGTAWAQVASPATGGHGLGMAFDGVRRQIVRHGGSAIPTHNSETWVFGAQATSFGGGCAGSNGTPALAAVGVPRLAEPWTLTLSGAAVASPFAIVVFGTAAIGPIPLGAIGMPGCSAWISPDLLLSIPAAGGIASWGGTLPGQAGLVGVHLYAQGLSFDPGINAAWLTASNAVDGLLGR